MFRYPTFKKFYLRAPKTKLKRRCAELLLGLLLPVAVAWPATGVARARGQEKGGGQQVNDEAARQMQEMYDEKESRTPAQKKLDSQLIYALKQKRGETRGVPTQRIDLKPDAKGRVLVDITARVSARLLKKIRKLGGEVVSTSDRYHTTRAWLALEKLEVLAAAADVRFIAPAAQAMTNSGAMTN